MKSIINKILSGRGIALALIACLASSAWAAAPTPTVIWDGDFSSLSKTVGGVTYSINNIGAGTDNTSVNICASDNSYLQIVNSDNGYAVPTITATGGDAPFGSSEDGATVIAFYREMPIGEGVNRAVLSLLSPNVTFNNCHVNAGVCRFGNNGGGNTAASFINGGQWNNGTITQQVLSGGEQMIAFVCKSEGGMSYYINGREISTDSRSLDFTPTGVCLGGMDNSDSSKFHAMKNMKILGVAIFNRELTAEEVAEFSFAKWNTSNKWRYNDTLAYREPTSGTASDFAYATVAMVGVDGVADTSTFALNTPKHHPYTVLNEPSGNYVSPGVALVFDAAGYKAPPQPNFGDLILGGLHVTANRADGVPYALASSTGGARTTALGDKSGCRESYFVFDESFSISRQGNQNTANTKLYGVVNIEVASGKTFTLNGNGETGLGATNIMTTAGTTAPVLKMAGGGKFKIGTLVASSGTLDFSGVTATPFIQGALTVNNSTVFKFPALAGAATYQLASRLVDTSGVTGDQIFFIGGHEYQAPLSFNDVSGTVVFPAVATLAGSETAVNWSAIPWDAKPATIDSTTVATLNITGNTTLDIAAAATVKKLVLNISDGVTLTLVNAGNLTTVDGIVIRGTGTLKIDGAVTFAALTVEDNATIEYNSSATALTVTGALTVNSGKTLTLAPAALTSVSSATLLTVDSMSGTVAVTTPEDAGNTYDVVKDATAVTLKRTPIPAFSYDAVPGGAPSGWGITSWCDSTDPEYFRSKLRVGPNSTFAQVYEATSGEYPWQNLGAKSSAFTFAVYVDVSKVSTTEKRVIASFGNKYGGDSVMLYREGDYIKAAFVTSNGSLNGSAATVTAENGYHLYTVVCNPSGETPTLTLYKDGEAGVAASPTTTVSLGAGIGLGTSYYGAVSGFNNGENLAFAAIVGYDTQLTTGEIANLSSVKFPKTTGGTFSHTVINTTADTTLTVYSSTTTSADARLGVTSGTTTIPAGETVNVVNVRTSDAGTGTTGTLNINGTLNVSAESTNKDVAGSGGNTGVVIGWWGGSTTVKVPTGGVLNAPNAYLEIPYSSTATTETLEINGGTVKVKGIYANKASVSTVELRSGGVLEVGEIVDTKAFTLNLMYGTLRINSDATLSSATFGAASGNATTIDPHGNNITVSNGALNGSGDITVADSAGGGTVTFVGGSSYSGRIILTDANSARIDISDFTGTVECQGTTAATLEKLNGFAGTVYFTSTVDASAIDLSRATVNVAADCTYTATAGQEGKMVLGTGATAKLKVTTDVSNYEGHVPSVSGAGSVEYWLSDGEQTQLTGEHHLNGKNLLPYYYVWTPSETASENTISANAAARWKVGSLPTANKNVAFKISADTTVLVDATVTYGEVQVYGTGILTFQSADGTAAMTVAKKLQTTSTTAVQIDSGIVFGAGAELEVVSALPLYMTAVNCGTEVAPYEIPAITGGGIAYVAEGKYLTTAEINAGTFYALGNATVTDSAAIGTLQVQPTGVLTLDSANVSVSGTATIGGTVNVDATSTFIPTAVSDAGSVVWTGKQPDGSVWNTSADWTGTNVVINATGLTDMNPANWGNASSFIKLNGVAGYFVKTDVEATAKKTILEDNGANAALQISNGYQGSSVTFRKIAGDGTIADTHNHTTAWHMLIFKDATEFTGSIKATQTSGCKKFVFSDAGTGTASASGSEGRLVVQSDGHAVIGAGKEWKPANSIHIAGEVKLLGAATMSKPVTINGTTAKLLLADTALTINNTLTFANGAKLTIDPGTIALSSTPATLITGLTNTEEPVVTGITVPGCTVSVGGTSGAYTIQATLGSGVWASGDGDWTETSFNGTEQSTDGSAVTFRASANDSVTVTLTGTRAPSTIAFNGGSATTYTLKGGTFSPSGTVTVESGTVTIESAATGTYVVDAGATLSLTNATVTSVSGTGTLEIPRDGTVTLTTANAIDGIASLSGEGTLVMPSDSLPTSTLQTLLKNSSNWKGTLALSGLGENSAKGFNFSNYGNANSKIQLTNCWIKYLDNGSSYFEGCLVLCDDASHNAAFTTSDGYSDKYNKIGELAGNGAISATRGPLQMYCFLSAPNYTGSISITGGWDSTNKKYDGRRIVFGEPLSSMDSSSDPGSIRIKAGVQVGLGEGATWNAAYGIYIGGTIIVNGNASLTSNTSLDHESDNPINLRGDKYIVFHDGAKLNYRKLCTITTTGDVTLAAGSTVAIAFSDGVTLVDGTKLIGWSAAPAGTFAFDDGDGGATDHFTQSGTDYVLSSESDGLYLRAAVATATTAGSVTSYHNTLAGAVTAAGAAGTVTLLANLTGDVALLAGAVLRLNGNTLTGSVTTVSGYVVGLKNSVYTSYNASSTNETWTDDGGDHAWSNSANWNLGFVPVATTGITFNNGAVPVISANVVCGGLTVNGTATISGSGDVQVGGSVTAGDNAKLVLSGVCLKNTSGSALTIAMPVDLNNAALADSMTISGAVAISGTFHSWGAAQTFSGVVSIASGADIKINENDLTVSGTTTFNGNFTKSANTTENKALILGAVTVAENTVLTVSNGSVTFGGVATVQSGKTLTIPASGVTVSGSFVLGAATAKLVDNGNSASGKVNTTVANSVVVATTATGVTTYEVAAITEPVAESTTIDAAGIDGKIAIPINVTVVEHLAPADADRLVLKVEYTPEGGSATTGYYTNILTVDGSGNVSLIDNTSATALVNGAAIKVKPEVAESSPMTLGGTTPGFTVKTIPGLYYTVEKYNASTEEYESAGDASLATTTTTTIGADNEAWGEGENVRYYRIKVSTTGN